MYIFTKLNYKQRQLQMKQRKKWASICLATIFILSIGVSCQPSQYKTYKRMVKRRGMASGYKSHYQKRLKRHTMPINKNYIIRNNRSNPSWQ
jgi:hypothetical protein